MRKSRKVGLIGALALVAALAVSGIATAGTDTLNGVTQSLESTVSPSKKLPKKATKKVDPKNVELNIAVGISDANGQKPPPASNVNINLGKDLTFTTKGIPQCAQTSIATANTATAKSACKKSIVGAGSASATCSGNTNPPDIPGVVVTAFNGTQSGGNPVILLHTVADLGGSEQIQILPGILAKGISGFGKQLQVTVPPLAGGACSIVDFETTVGKGEIDKKYEDYVGATCKDGQIDFGSEFTYVSGTSNPQGVSTLSPEDEVPCTAKG